MDELDSDSTADGGHSGGNKVDRSSMSGAAVPNPPECVVKSLCLES